MPRQPSVVDKYFGARFRAARLEAGKSQTQVAEALGRHLPATTEVREGHEPHFRGHAP
jgi:transcriptional regulator with XRE-family HTH domain